MSQYAREPLEHRLDKRPYREWPISEPTTRRLDLYVMSPRDVAWAVEWHGSEGRRLALIEDTYGDNCIQIATSSEAEFRAVMASPGYQRRNAEWQANAPRYGSWGWYAKDVALVRSIFEFAGWTMTEDELTLMDALEAYGRRAPLRLQRAA